MNPNSEIIKLIFQKIKYIKFGYSEKARKFEKIFRLKFDTTQ